MKTIKNLQNAMGFISFAMMTIFFISMSNAKNDTSESVATTTSENWNTECGIGEIKMFVGNFAPRDWALCDGQLLSIASNQALFSIVGTTYGGDGRTTFQLPDLRGRVAMHAGTGAGLTPRPLGQRGGSENTQLTHLNLPAHNHTAAIQGKVKIYASTNSPDESNPNGTFLTDTGDKKYSSSASLNTYMADTDMSGVTVTTGQTGGNQPISNMQPYTTVNYIICINGSFPSRN